MNIKKLTFPFIACAASIAAQADDYVIIGKETKVFDEPNATGYVTLNTKNEEVVLQPGMAFKIHDNSQGWYIIEYSPGLRGYLSEQAKSSSSSTPKAGIYTVSNNPSVKLDASGSDGKWTAKVGEKLYSGMAYGNVVIFLNDKGDAVYSLTDLGSGPVVMSYDNDVTNFF